MKLKWTRDASKCRSCRCSKAGEYLKMKFWWAKKGGSKLSSKICTFMRWI